MRRLPNKVKLAYISQDQDQGSALNVNDTIYRPTNRSRSNATLRSETTTSNLSTSTRSNATSGDGSTPRFPASSW